MTGFLLAAALLAAPAVAADKAADAKPDRRVCRHVVETGSRLARADECHLASEWVEIDKARSESARRLVDGVSGGAAALNAPISNHPF